MRRAVIVGVSIALLAFSLPASAQQAPSPEAAAAPAAAKAKKAIRKKKAAAKNASELVLVNNRSAAVTGLTITGKDGKALTPLKSELQPGKKLSVRLPKNAGCTFAIDASFSDDAPFEASDVNLCLDKTVRFTD